jgi:HAMP domain-containing protein
MSSVRPSWHRRARHALAHSLRVRLVALFLLLALAMAATFLFGMQKAFSIGWRDAARPLVVDYVDRLAGEIGSPPSIERAQALVQRLPVAVRISGPQVNWRSHPSTPEQERRWNDANRWKGDEPRLLERTTADGHRIHLALNVAIWQDQPRVIGWATLAVLLLLTGLAYLRVRRLLRPLDDIRAGALRFGVGDFAQPIPVRHPARPDELGELAATINTMGGDIRQMLDAKRALLLAISHELRSPLTRARLNTELLPETPDVLPARDALLRDLGQMRDLITDLLESERLASPHAALHLEPVDLAALVGEVVASLEGAPTVQLTLASESAHAERWTAPASAAAAQPARQRTAPQRRCASAARNQRTDRAGGPRIRQRPRHPHHRARPRPRRARRPTAPPGPALLPPRRSPRACHRRRRPGPVPLQAGGAGARRQLHGAQRVAGAGSRGDAAGRLSILRRLPVGWLVAAVVCE